MVGCCKFEGCMRAVKGDYCRAHKPKEKVMKKLERPLPGVTMDLVFAVRVADLDMSEGPIRSGDWTQREAFSELMRSIEVIGQMTPILIQEGRKGLYRIVAGWRRVAAIKKLNERDGTDIPILAVCVPPSDASDRLEMVLASGTSEPLNPPELAIALAELSRLYEDEAEHREEGKRSDRDIADAVGLSLSYVHRLLMIARCAHQLMNRWRDDYPMVPVNMMAKIARLDTPELRVEAYDKLVTSRGHLYFHR